MVRLLPIPWLSRASRTNSWLLRMARSMGDALFGMSFRPRAKIESKK